MLQIDGLRSFNVPGTHLAVVGYPIAHSISPIFQNAALQTMARQYADLADWTYHKIEAPVEELQQVIELTTSRGFRGLNLTLPHKVEVLPYLDRIDPVAKKMGAVNTLSFDSAGVTGYNTDGDGISRAIRHALEIGVEGRAVVVLGAGGASRAACVRFLEEGCSELWVGNRSLPRLESMLDHLRREYPGRAIHGFQSGLELPEPSEDALLVQATSLGLKPDDPLPADDQLLSRVAYVYDMVYGRKPTPLVRAALRLGKPASDGLPMLLYQGARSLEIWTGLPVPVEAMAEAVARHHGKLDNVSVAERKATP